MMMMMPVLLLKKPTCFKNEAIFLYSQCLFEILDFSCSSYLLKFRENIEGKEIDGEPWGSGKVASW